MQNRYKQYFDCGNNKTVIDDSTTFLAKDSVYINNNVVIKKNCTIYPGVVIEDNVYIGNNVIIQSGTIIKSNVCIEDNVFIGSSCLIRNNCWIQQNSTIGFNCEIKASKIESNCLIAHKCFVGNAILKKGVKIGCGLVTANFNNNKFNTTFIGENTEVGINCSLIAPIRIGKNCFIAACSILRDDLLDNQFVKTQYINKIVNNKKIHN